MQSEKSLRYPNLRKGLLSKYKHYSLISKLIQNIFYTLHITTVKIIRTYYIKKMLNFNIFRMSNKKNKKVLIMTQIQNFGFIACVQEPSLQYPTRKGFGTWEPGRKHESHEPAFRHPYHTGAHGQGFGCHFLIRYDHFQQPDRTLSPFQIPPSQRNGTSGDYMF